MSKENEIKGDLIPLDKFIQYETLKNVNRAQKFKSVPPTTSKIEIKQNDDFDLPLLEPIKKDDFEIINCVKSLLELSKSWDKNIKITDLMVKSNAEYRLLKQNRETLDETLNKCVDKLIKQIKNDKKWFK